jgi:tetratricopeptide (TPR) repeat protein
LGELGLDEGNISEARAQFDAAAASWTGDLPDAASVEARCESAALDPKLGNSSRISLSIEQARKMGRLSSEAECLIAQARVYVSNGRHAEALAALDKVPLEGERTVGNETRARVHYWRGRARSAAGDRAGAETDGSQARDLIENLRLSLPAAYRDRYAARAGIHQMLER